MESLFGSRIVISGIGEAEVVAAGPSRNAFSLTGVRSPVRLLTSLPADFACPMVLSGTGWSSTMTDAVVSTLLSTIAATTRAETPALRRAMMSVSLSLNVQLEDAIFATMIESSRPMFVMATTRGLSFGSAAGSGTLGLRAPG